MPTYTVKSPEGEDFEVDSERPPTQDEARQLFEAYKKSAPQQPAPAQATTQATTQAPAPAPAAPVTPESTLANAVKSSGDLINFVDRGPFPVNGPMQFGRMSEQQGREVLALGDAGVAALPVAGAVAGTLLAGNPVAGFAAGSVIGEELANLAQGHTPTTGERVTQAVGMLPIGRASGAVGNVVGNYIQQAIAKTVGKNVDQAIAGQTPTPLAAGEYVSPDMLMAAAVPAGSGVLGKVDQAFKDFRTARANGADLREALKTSAVGSFIRPDEISIEQKTRNAARGRTEATTGTKIPVTVSEAIGKSELQLTKNEITPDTLQARQNLAIWAASKNPELGNMDLRTKSEYIRSMIKNEGTSISTAVADDVANSVNAVVKQLGGEVKQAVPGTLSESANRLRDAFNAGWKVAKDSYDAAYTAVRGMKGYKEVTGYPEEAQKTVSDIVKQRDGVEIEGRTKAVFKALGAYNENLPNASKLSPEEYLAAVQKDNSNPITIDNLRGIRTELFESIGNDGIFPSLSKADKQRLVNGISNDIDALVNKADPAVRPALKDANAKYKDAMVRYNHDFFEKTSQSFGEQGGAGSGTIFAHLSGKSGGEYVTLLKGMAKDEPKILISARDTIVADLQKEHGSDPQKMVEAINGMATEVQTEFFPNLGQIKALANRAASLSGIVNLEGKVLLSNIKDTDAFAAALTDKRKGAASAAVEALLTKTADDIKLFKNNVLQDASLAGNQPRQFVEGVTSGSLYEAIDVKKVMDSLEAKSPDAAANVRQIAINRLLDRSSGDTAKSSNASKLLKELNDPDQAPRLVTLLGQDTYDFMVQTAKDLKTLEPGLPDVKKPASIISTLTKATSVGGATWWATKSPYWTVGSFAVSAATESLYNLIPNLQNLGTSAKHKIAAQLLSTPEMRQMAVTPVDKLDPNQSRLLGAFLAEEIRRQEKSQQPVTQSPK